MGREAILQFDGMTPRVPESAFLAPGSWVIGNVEIGENSSIWFNTVVRGDVHYIRIGKDTNIQDGSVCHVTTDKNPLNIGNEVTVGHMVILHGCTVEDACLVGMGSMLLDECVIGAESFIAAGSLVTPRTRIPPRSFVMGRPARVVRLVTDEEVGRLHHTAEHYVALARSYLEGTPRPKWEGPPAF